jgi:hypothetical protein
MPRPPSDPDYLRMLQQADEARGDFAATLDELDFVKRRLSRLSALAALSAKAAPDQQYGCLPRPALTFGLEDQPRRRFASFPLARLAGRMVAGSVVLNRRLASPDRGLNGLGN